MQLWLALLPYIVSAVGLIASLGLFSGMARHIRKNGKQVAACEASLQSEAAQLTNAINELKRRLADLESAELRTSADPQPVSDLSGAARGRVFKLHRAGQASSDIAHKLRLSQGEVELLIKAQKIVMRPYEDEMAPAGGGAEKG
ncbi:MAG TPA: hypothetical protein VKG79_16010 [Bryobacteraceae bacterium]|nr:hypothetical protein [Bryobacteraceae bacterium]